jgi:ribonuclease E
MVTMDDSTDTPVDEAQGTGGATAYGSLFSHDETGAPTARTAATRATRATAKKATRSATTSARTEDEVAEIEQPEGSEDAEGTDDPNAEESRDGATQPSSSPFGLLFQAPDLSAVPTRPARSRSADADYRSAPDDDSGESGADAEPESSDRPRRQRRRSGRGEAPQQDRAEGQSGSSDGQAGADPDGDDSQDGESSEESEGQGSPRRRRRGGKGRRGRGGSGEDSGESESQEQVSPGSEDEELSTDGDSDGEEASGTVRRRRRSNRRGEDGEARESRRAREEVAGVRGSTRLEAKRQRRREGREAGRRRTIITEAEFLARRESVERTMVVRGLPDRTQIGVLEDGVLVEHYVSRQTQTTMAGNVYLGRVQNVLPSMEAAFVDIGKGRNAVLYAGEVNWDAAGLESNAPKRIENALKPGDSVLVQVTKDPIGHKGARLTSQVSLPGRYLVLVPGNSMTGISRKLPDTERTRLKKILKEVVPESAGVIVRTAAEGASEEELRADVERLTSMWQRIESKQKGTNAPALVHGEPDMTVRVIRDVFNEDFAKVVVAGEDAWNEVSDYVNNVAPDLADRVEKWTGTEDVFTHYRVTEALAKAMDRKVWLPSGGSLVIDRTEAMTVVDVNTGKFVGSGGNLEETVTKNNIEAAEEIVRQLRLRDIGGIIVIDFIDMVLESNRDLVVRRLLECLGRDRTKHQVAEVTSLGLVQMTRKRVGAGLIEVFSEPCVHCNGRGIVVHSEPIEKSEGNGNGNSGQGGGRRGRGRSGGQGGDSGDRSGRPTPPPGGPTPAQIAAAAHAAAIASASQSEPVEEPSKEGPADDQSKVDPADDQSKVDPADDQSKVGPADDQSLSELHTDEGSGAAPEREMLARERETERGAALAADLAPAAVPVAQHEPAPRPRRRRGRVVAPAGPPGAVATVTPDTASEESSTEGP